jgi:excisionase family DNA binding protein
MFYSQQEAADKLGVTVEKLEQIVADGKLREFRDGSNVLFKVDDIENLAKETPSQPQEKTAGDDTDLLLPDENLKLQEETADTSGAGATDILPDKAEEGTPKPPAAKEKEIPLEPKPAGETAGTPAAGATDILLGNLEEETPKPPAAKEEELILEPEPAGETAGTSAAGVTDILLGNPEEDTPKPTAAKEEDITLEEEPEPSVAPGASTGLAGAETTLAKPVDAPGETKGDQLIDSATTGAAGSSSEASLEEIEQDVNLDTFGSGSGLLDLSLQADDTSLGGILDEIYAPEAEKPAGGDAALGSAADVAAEAEQMMSAEMASPGSPLPAAALAGAYIEPEPDTQSNILGGLLFLPMLAAIYMAIVTVASFSGVMPGVLQKAQGLIWYIVGATIFAALLLVAFAFLSGGGGGTKSPAKAKKVKTPKKPKKAKA